MTILIVDDDPNALKFIKAALEKSGYTVITSDNARDALSILVHTPINLIIADVIMPEIDGNEFCRIVRADKALEYVPIIFLSAKFTVDDVAQGMVAGADDYLTKPIKLKELLDKIEEFAM
jgi:DNA-binding response OmpR family regulator